MTFTEPETIVEYARTRWEEGETRIQRFTPNSRRRDALELVVDAIMHELEKRIGQIFSSIELATMQDSSESWCTRIAHETAPGMPFAWEMDTVQNAAFHRYSRRATDYQLNL